MDQRLSVIAPRRIGQRQTDREIQFAAAAAWPHSNKANAGIRAEFQLPPDRAMK